MARKAFEFQPGAILHDVVSGVFRVNGTSLEQWCNANGLKPMNVRYALCGVVRSEAARASLERVLEGAGRDDVAAAYRRRMTEHFEMIVKGAA